MKRKKLQLNRQTIRTLDDLRGVTGGTGNPHALRPSQIFGQSCVEQNCGVAELDTQYVDQEIQVLKSRVGAC